MGPWIQTSKLLLGMCLLATPFASGQDKNAPGDFHTRDDDARHLYAISAFAHGHRHGYEEGYRAADFEIHIGRLERNLREADVPKADYKKEFGDRKQFQQGFIYGFMTGYKDSFSDRSFRLVEWSAAVPPLPSMSELPQADPTMTPDPKLRANFEDGILQGYRDGVKRPEGQIDAEGLAGQAREICGRSEATGREGYCDGFTQGFLLGVNDHTVVTVAVPGAEPGLAQKAAAGQPHSAGRQ
jgi:hypothetical protein